MTGPPTPQSFLNTPTQSVNSTTPGTSPTITPPTPATTASLDQNLSTNVSASNSTPDPEIVEDFEPTAEVSGVVHNEGQLPLQSCYCVVCLKCFFCLKPYHNYLNTHCLCKDNTIPSLPQTQPENAEVMSTNTYKRAYTIDWVKRHADENAYNLNTGFQIDEGELNSIPLCDEHYQEYVEEWEQFFHGEENVLEGLGIHPDPETEERILSGFQQPAATPRYYVYKFQNWVEGRPREVRCFTNFPVRATDDHILHQDAVGPTTFGDLFRVYFDMLGINDSEFVHLVFHDPDTNQTYRTWKDMKEVFMEDGITNRIFNVGLMASSYKELFA